MKQRIRIGQNQTGKPRKVKRTGALFFMKCYSVVMLPNNPMLHFQTEPWCINT